MKKTIIVLFLISSLIFLPAVFAKSGHMKLLAIRETDAGIEGGIADLYLEVKPGSGRVFLETFPLTKIDTQMSTRFAKAIACDLTEQDCDSYDFFYTITADSAVITGPSAGASIAVLTVAMLKGLDVNEKYSITGTINSGGLIGPVGGLKAKIEAAKKADLKKAFIPAGEIIAKVDNTTVDLKNLSKQLNIEILEVSTLSEAIKHFTGREIQKKFRKIEISGEYTNTMKSLAKELCDRSSRLKTEESRLRYSTNVSELKENARNLTSKGREAFEKQTFYSSASYCFGANVEYSTLTLLSKNFTKQSWASFVGKIKEDIHIFQKKVDQTDRKTITDLEAYMVVKERLAEAEDSANQALEILNRTNKTERAARATAYALERVNSAHSWASFLGKEGKEFNLNSKVLKKSCQSKISEADERQQYVDLYFPGTVNAIKNQIDKANKELEKSNYELCLSQASKAKAEVDLVLNVLGVSPEQYKNILERKLDIVKNSIAEQASKGAFPILSYSYYEYANSLKDTDIFSALLYSEYALELSNLNIYFNEAEVEKFSINIDNKLLGIFLIGVFVGFLAAFFTYGRQVKLKHPNKKKKRQSH